MILLSCLFLLSISTDNKYLSQVIEEKKEEIEEIIPFIPEKEKELGTLTIPKINVIEKFYSQDSSQNTIEKHVSILYPSTFPSILILAAHSGSGNVAYFKDLNQLSINDEIYLTYENNNYQYIVENIWEEDKTGFIHIKRDNKNQLILTTCSPNHKDKQIIVNCTIKES